MNDPDSIHGGIKQIVTYLRQFIGHWEEPLHHCEDLLVFLFGFFKKKTVFADALIEHKKSMGIFFLCPTLFEMPILAFSVIPG